MSLDSDSKVHINKSISIMSLIQIIIIVVSFGVVYGETKTAIKEIKK